MLQRRQRKLKDTVVTNLNHIIEKKEECVTTSTQLWQIFPV